MRRVAVLLVIALFAACSSSGSPEPDPDSSIAAVLGIGTVDLLGPDEEESVRAPQFRWAPVGDASAYLLVVLAADGSPIWSWEGAETEVWMGGHGVELPSGLATPVATPGSTWTVVALSDEGIPVAMSGRRMLNGSGAIPSDSTAPPTATGTSTTEPSDDVQPEILEVCGAVDPDAVQALTGPGVSGTPSDLIVGEELIGRSCDFGGAFVPVLTLGVYSGGIDSWVSRCDLCAEYEGLGEEASGGVGVAGNGQEVGYLYARAVGLTFRAESTGVPVTLGLLEALIQSLVDAHS